MTLTEYPKTKTTFTVEIELFRNFVREFNIPVSQEHVQFTMGYATIKLDAEFFQVIAEKFSAGNLTQLIRNIHDANIAAGWWTASNGDDLRYDPMVQAAKILLIHSELSEAVEYHRKGGNDSHLTDVPGVAVELADVFIRWADIVGALGYGEVMEEIIARKREYNRRRIDHTATARAAEGGKKY